MAAILKVSVRFTLKVLRCEVGILFLQIAVMFEMKKNNESKRKHRVPEFFHKQEEKRPFNNVTIKLAAKQSVLNKSVFRFTKEMFNVYKLTNFTVLIN